MYAMDCNTAPPDYMCVFSTATLLLYIPCGTTGADQIDGSTIAIIYSIYTVAWAQFHAIWLEKLP